jgi:adenylate cyclase
MNRYMTAMTKRIIDNNGTLDKYIGDAQMAFWNAPLDDADHAKNAVRTAMDMLKDLETFNEEVEKEGIPAFGMGLGINTATVVVGNMGSDQRLD